MEKSWPRLLLLGSVLLFSGRALCAATNDPPCSFKQVTERIYVIVGSDHEACPKADIEHPVTNPAVIVGDDGVIVVDPGGSLQIGRLVLDRMNAISEKPVVAVLNTHIHGLYWLGNQAVKARFPAADIYAHPRMIERIERGEGDFWVQAITGSYKGDTTHYVKPNVPVQDGETIRIAGVTLKSHHPGHGHTDHDLIIEVPEERAVFLGGIVVEPEVPSQGVPADADFKGQIGATRYVIDLNAEKYIPGRGHPSDISLPQRALRFLESLYDGVEKYYEVGFSDYEVSQKLKEDLSAFQQWYDFTALGGVVSQMYLQVEAANF